MLRDAFTATHVDLAGNIQPYLLRIADHLVNFGWREYLPALTRISTLEHNMSGAD
jgi:hypothetical protein